jgi:hypothetical protein
LDDTGDQLGAITTARTALGDIVGRFSRRIPWALFTPNNLEALVGQLKRRTFKRGAREHLTDGRRLLEAVT